MHFLEATYPTPELNLACDQALLEGCEAGECPEVLRVWESDRLFAVPGYTNKVAEELIEQNCVADRVPILRRGSGGGTVLQGPGCLCYALILRIEREPALASLTSTNAYIMERQRAAIESVSQQEVTIEGYTDLAVTGLKFSGNAQRRKRACLLFHGTFLLNFDLSLISRYLRQPPRQPAYRTGRDHSSFVANLALPAATVVAALRQTWGAETRLLDPPNEAIAKLAVEPFGNREWNYKF